MKHIYRFCIFLSCLLIFGCSQSGKIEKVIVCIDPNNAENKKSETSITEKDAIDSFITKFDQKKEAIRKFYPRYSIEIKYADKSILYLGNSNFIKDVESGKTYELSAKDWEIYNY